MQKIAMYGQGSLVISTIRNLTAGLSGFDTGIMHIGSDPKIGIIRLLPGGKTQAKIADTIPRFNDRSAPCIFVQVEQTWDISCTRNPVVPNRVLGAVFPT